jgi:hypothetical protein
MGGFEGSKQHRLSEVLVDGVESGVEEARGPVLGSGSRGDVGGGQLPDAGGKLRAGEQRSWIVQQ